MGKVFSSCVKSPKVGDQHEDKIQASSSERASPTVLSQNHKIEDKKDRREAKIEEKKGDSIEAQIEEKKEDSIKNKKRIEAKNEDTGTIEEKKEDRIEHKKGIEAKNVDTGTIEEKKEDEIEKKGIEAKNKDTGTTEEKKKDTEIRETSSSIKNVVPVEEAPISLHRKEYLNYPFVLDAKTIEHIKNCKLMVILKGLPGSGKSSISRRLSEVYEGCVVCSADDYFMQDGVYQFDCEKLKDAHKACQDKAKEAAERGDNVIVIDNTNVKIWESKCYLQLAGKNKYVPLIVEPQTPWRMDPVVLVQRNKHGVSQEVLERKVKDYEKALPLYYWWYLNERDSEAVNSIAQQWLRKALNVSQFFKDFAEFSKLSTIDDMLSYFGKSRQSAGYDLHATACVTRRGKEKNSLDYINSTLVKESLGKCFHLCIIGYVITPRAFGARVRLGERELELWGMDDQEIELEEAETPSKISNQSSPRINTKETPEAQKTSINNTSDIPKPDAQNITTSNKSMNNTEDITHTQKSPITNIEKSQSLGTNHRTSLIVIYPEFNDSRFHPTCGKGSRAHLTLGCAPGIHAKVTGFDLINVVACEQKLIEGNETITPQKVESYDIENGVLRSYGEGSWVIYPEEEVTLKAIFAPYY